MSDELSEKFKKLEKDAEAPVLDSPIVGFRIDGKKFSTFTRDFEKPFDQRISDAMDNAVLTILSEILVPASIGYTQSDEISVIVETERLPHSGRVEKLLTLSASAATAGFNGHLNETGVISPGFAFFDARIFPLKDAEEVHDYLTWRRLDARKNAVSSAAHALFGEKRIKGLSKGERIDLLKGTKFEKLPEGDFNGRIFTKKQFYRHITYIDKRTDETIETRTSSWKWTPEPATREVTEEIVFRKFNNF